MKLIDNLLLPVIGVAIVIGLWTAASVWVSAELPSPIKTWQESKLYIMEPFVKRGEMDQGIGLLAGYSLLRSQRLLPWHSAGDASGLSSGYFQDGS
ncbi:MAG: hypothetical protein WKF37_03035 [Bryobacteraceae bacterium]